MPRTRPHPRQRAQRPPARWLYPRWLIVFSALAVGLIAGGYALGQTWQRVGAMRDDQPAVDYPAVLVRAATALDGASWRFVAEQHSILTPAPAASGSAASSGSPSIFHIVSTGASSPTSFWQSIYTLPPEDPPSAVRPDRLDFSYIHDATGAWRNDGDGWLPLAGSPPGVGMDEISAARLPDLLTHLSNIQALDPDDVRHPGLRGYAGEISPIDYPGVLAADGVGLTADPVLATAWLDVEDRLVQLESAALNLAFFPDQMRAVTTVWLTYGEVGPVPKPSPLFTADQGEAIQP